MTTELASTRYVPVVDRYDRDEVIRRIREEKVAALRFSDLESARHHAWSADRSGATLTIVSSRPSAWPHSTMCGFIAQSRSETTSSRRIVSAVRGR